MKKLLGVFIGVFGLGVLLIAALLSYIWFALPDVGPALDLSVELTPERIARGERLATGIYQCMGCHADLKYDSYGATLDRSTLGKGGRVFDHEDGLPGSYTAKNLTPYHLGDWSDGEIFRAITSGVRKDGTALFPIMPYPAFGQTDQEDILDIIAYLRSLSPIANEVPESSSDFPVNVLLNFVPKKAVFTHKPDIQDKVAYGRYLVNAGNCAGCHTQMEKGVALPGMDFAGGTELHLRDGGRVRSANITPHETTGIGAWTEEVFVAKFKEFQDPNSFVNTIVVEKGEANTRMPWRAISKLADEELAAIFAYLSSVEPVENLVQKFPEH